jgi:hypothetical protein
MVWIDNLFTDKYEDIIQFLDYLQNIDWDDVWFISLLDLRDNKNIFICRNPKIRQIIEKVLWLKFKWYIAKRKWLILRKELFPLILDNI